MVVVLYVQVKVSRGDFCTELNWCESEDLRRHKVWQKVWHFKDLLALQQGIVDFEHKGALDGLCGIDISVDSTISSLPWMKRVSIGVMGYIDGQSKFHEQKGRSLALSPLGHHRILYTLRVRVCFCITACR